MRRGRVVYAVGPAGEDHALIARGADLGPGDLVVRPDLCEHMLISHAAGNEQVVLPAEIQHKDGFLHGAHSTVTDFARFFGLSMSQPFSFAA